jgi:hypothetical protein
MVSRLVSGELLVKGRGRCAVLEIATDESPIDLISHLRQPWDGPRCNIRQMATKDLAEKFGRLVGYCELDCPPSSTSVEVAVLEVATTKFI